MGMPAGGMPAVAAPAMTMPAGAWSQIEAINLMISTMAEAWSQIETISLMISMIARQHSCRLTHLEGRLYFASWISDHGYRIMDIAP
jgi:hypothetical protein